LNNNGKYINISDELTFKQKKFETGRVKKTNENKNLNIIFKGIYSFEALYKTTEKNQKISLINEIYIQFLEEIIIDKHKIYKTNKYCFTEPGQHHIIAFLNIKKMESAELMFYNNSNLISINFSNQFFSTKLKNIYGIFKNCKNLTNVNFNNSTSYIINFSYAFQNCISLTSIDLSNIVTNKALNISYMFSNCLSLKSINLSGINAINIKDMSGLFYYCSSLTSIDFTSLKFLNVLNIKYMFAGCTLLSEVNLKFLQFSHLKDMSYIFKDCLKLTSIEMPDLVDENKIKKEGLFDGCEYFKKKYDVCIVGLWFGTNYGSLATYYALHQAVKHMGYSILMIDSPLAIFRKPNLDKCHPLTIGRRLYNISEPRGFNKLYEFNNYCEKFLAGSDQLWKPFISRPYKQFFFLDFVDDNKTKISYGTSFGEPYYGNEKEKIITRKNLKRFNSISVRDKLSLNITKKIFGLKNVVQVCDPTFICNFSDYEILINKSKLNISFEYILAYVLDPTEEIGYRLERLSIEKNITIIIILDENPNIWDKNKKNLFLKGIGNVYIAEKVDLNDFMWYYYHSKAVFTDSFHGSIFSIIFRKPFVTLLNVPRGGQRFFQLLVPLNLTYRLFEHPNCINDASYLYDKIDYRVPLKNLYKIKKFSYNWLVNALNQ